MGGPGGKERKKRETDSVDPQDKSEDGGLNNLLMEDVRVS